MPLTHTEDTALSGDEPGMGLVYFELCRTLIEERGGTMRPLSESRWFDVFLSLAQAHPGAWPEIRAELQARGLLLAASPNPAAPAKTAAPSAASAAHAL